MEVTVDGLQGRAVKVRPAYLLGLIIEGKVSDGFVVGLHGLDELFGGRIELVEQMEAKLLIGKRNGWFRVDVFEKGHDVIHEVFPLILVDID
jgi:hypothetical protein